MTQQEICLNKWMTNRENRNYIGDFLLEKEKKKIGIYGMGIIGTHLIWEIEQNECIEIAWKVDRNKSEANKPEELADLDDVDVLIIASINAVESIENTIKLYSSNRNFTVFAIEEIIDMVYSWGSKNG